MKFLCAFCLFLASAFAGEISERFFSEQSAILEKLKTETNSAAKDKILDQLTNTRTRPATEEIATNHGVSEIGIERTGCFGTCPAYSFVILSNGKCRYEGGDHAKIVGKKMGTIEMEDFHRLAALLRDLQFFAMRDDYRRGITDASSTFTTVVLGGKRKTIHNYAGAGPNRLWAIEQILDGILTRAKWDQ